MESINGASLKEHWAAQHCLHGSNSSIYNIAEYTTPKSDVKVLYVCAKYVEGSKASIVHLDTHVTNKGIHN